jgi:hypothetical protein
MKEVFQLEWFAITSTKLKISFQEHIYYCTFNVYHKNPTSSHMIGAQILISSCIMCYPLYGDIERGKRIYTL